MSHESRHFVDIVRRHAAERGDALAYRFLKRDVESEVLTFAGLDRAARAVSAALAGRTGERAMLLFPPGLDFVKAFVGCWYAGVIPVPCAPPLREHEVQRLLRIAKDAGITVVLTTAALRDMIRSQLEASDMPNIVCLETERLIEGDDDHPWHDPGLSRETIALLQYTSGSTSEPKGVVVSHGNLLHNEQTIQRFFQHDQDTRVVGWLPLYHDMGLIGNVLQPLWLGRDVTLMSPMDFMMHPLSWLRAISRYRATTSGGPNFAYELCASVATPEQIATLDLSCWTLAYNGAEPIRASTLERFAEVFAPCGFRREALYPCYGLAESTLVVSGGRKIEPVISRYYDRHELALHRARRTDSADEKTSAPLVSCGAAAGDTVIRIVGPETKRPLEDGSVGEIWVSGGSVAMAYWQRPEATEELLRASIEGIGGSWLRTGDLGFFDDGELFIAGRLKDLIIIRGRNHHPQDIEETAWTSHAALRVGRAAAFTVDVDGEERLVIVQEVAKSKGAFEHEEIRASVRSNVARVHGLALHDLVLARSGQIPKTSSGKIRRLECRKLFLEKGLRLYSVVE